MDEESLQLDDNEIFEVLADNDWHPIIDFIRRLDIQTFAGARLLNNRLKELIAEEVILVSRENGKRLWKIAPKKVVKGNNSSTK